MRIALGSDDPTPLTEAIAGHLAGVGHEVVEIAMGRPWPEVGRSVGESVVSGRADLGVACCWTGTGVSIAANKVAGARAALCNDAVAADGARRWNDANVLALSLRSASTAIAIEIIDAFIAGQPDPAEAGLLPGLE